MASRHGIKKAFGRIREGFGEKGNVEIDGLVTACLNMSKTRTGAIILMSGNTDAGSNTGDSIEADVSARLLETIFYKNSPCMMAQ